jgi:hypothetical protein
VEIDGHFKSACPQKTNIYSTIQRLTGRDRSKEDEDAYEDADTVVDYSGEDGRKKVVSC